MITHCPTCGSDDRDVFLPVLFSISRCKDGWHEDRIVKRRPKSGKAASRRTFWPSGFTVHYKA